MGGSVDRLLKILLIALSCAAASKCGRGFFKLDEESECHPLLNCTDLLNITINEMIGRGAVKLVYRANWNRFNITISELANQDYFQDFLHGWNMLLKFQGPLVVKAVGFCNETKTIMTQFHKHGNAVDLISRLAHFGIEPINPKQRLRLCYNYAQVLNMLHAEKMVNCDSNTLSKTLSQLLVDEKAQLLLNDMDSIGESVNGITCGPRLLDGDFVAPEQVSDGFPLPSYDEKTDIWKAATVCNYFLSQLPDSAPILYRLHDIHSGCKSPMPYQRPTAQQLAAAYLAEIAEHDEL